MLNFTQWIELFNVASVRGLAELWLNIPTEVKIASPFYFKDLFEEYPQFKASFVPVCSTCLLNTKTDKGLDNGLSYDELMEEGKFEVRHIFLSCGYCKSSSHFHRNISSDMTVCLTRKMVLPSDILTIHSKVVDYFNLMSVGKVRNWKDEQEFLLSVMSCEILVDGLLEDDDVGVSHNIEYDDYRDIDVCLNASLMEPEFSYKKMLSTCAADKIVEYHIDKYSPTFCHREGSSFLYPLSPLQLGLGFSNNSPSMISEITSNSYLPFEFIFEFKIKVRNIKNNKLYPFFGDISLTYSDPFLKYTRFKVLKISKDQDDFCQFYALLRFSERSLIVDYLNYNIAVNNSGLLDFMCLDITHTYDKSFVVECDCSCDVSMFHHIWSDSINLNPKIIDNEMLDEKFPFVKPVHNISDKKNFSYYDQGDKVRVTNLEKYYFGFRHKRTVLSRALINFETTNIKSELGYGLQLDPSFVGTDAFPRSLRFNCYRCYSAYVEGAVIDSYNCECSHLDSFSATLIREQSFTRRDTLRFYPFDHSAHLNREGFKCVYTVDRSYLIKGKCQGCGFTSDNLMRPLYTRLRYCQSCIYNHCGLPSSLSSELRSNKKLFDRYVSPVDDWSCDLCDTVYSSTDVKILTRCVHAICCEYCSGPYNLCLDCRDKGVFR